MRIEKICEYLNDIGILQLDNIDRFLKIYSQLSQNKYKNNSDKLILALFSYITLISKNEQQLYDICRNIVNCFSNNLILYRYRALSMFNNIVKNKIHSKYILFLSKLNSFIYNKKRRNNKYTYLNQNLKGKNSNSKKEIIIDNIENIDNESITNRTNTSIGKNNVKKNNKKRSVSKKKNNQNNNFKKIYDISDDDKECTFSPKINRYYKPNYKINNNHINNYNSEFYSSNNYSNDNNNDNSFNTKFIPFKNSINYGYNDKINNEIVKMLANMSKYSNNPYNIKYLPKKTVYRKQINNIYPSNSYDYIPSFSNNNYINSNEVYTNNDFNNNELNNNNAVYHYYDEDYDFYENEKEHVKKVQDKILQLKLQKLDKMSKECTFSPEINKNPKYLNNTIQNNNFLTEYNISHRNFFHNNNNNINNNINTNQFNKSFNNKKNSKNKNNKINDEYADDYYNVYPKKLNNNQNKRPRSYSGSKNNNEYSVYKARKEELNNLFNEQYPFMPTIKYNKNIQIKSTFDERQKKFIKDKEEIYKQKEKEELKQIEELKKKERRAKTDSKEVVKRLYNKEAEKIKERLEKEKKEKSKKKNIIDWSKKANKYHQQYPDDFKNNRIIKNKKINNNQENKKEENVIDFNSFSNNIINKNKKNIINNDNRNQEIDYSNYSKDNTAKKEENKIVKKNEIKKKENINDYNPFYQKNKDKKILNNNKKSNKASKASSKEKRDEKEINKNQILLMDKIKDEHVIGFKNNSSNISNNSINNNINNINDQGSKKDEGFDDIDNIYSSELYPSINENMKKYEQGNLLDNMIMKGGIRSNALQGINNEKDNQ